MNKSNSLFKGITIAPALGSGDPSSRVPGIRDDNVAFYRLGGKMRRFAVKKQKHEMNALCESPHLPSYHLLNYIVIPNGTKPELEGLTQ